MKLLKRIMMNQPFQINPDELKYSWTATVRLYGGQVISIWWTAWPSTKKDVEEIISISSDIPRFEINRNK
jgi:hypothetical protein